MRLSLLFAAAALLCASCDVPRDPNGTLRHVQGDTLFVGVSENAPWIERSGDEAIGVEGELVRRLTDELGAHVVWVWGGVEEHLEALASYELDLAAVGLTRATPWQERVALTQPYYTTRFAVGVPRAHGPLDDIEGRRVAVPRGSILADPVEKRGGIPVRVLQPDQAQHPVAAATWQLERWGLVPTDITLHESEHVLAAPPGENAWIVHLDTFLEDYQGRVAQQLKTVEGE